MIKKPISQLSYYTGKAARLIKSKGQYLVLTPREMRALDRKHKDAVMRKLPINYETNIHIKDQKAVLSYARDAWIDQISKSATYILKCPRVIVNPYGNAPLTAIVIFHTENPCKVRFTVKGTQEKYDISDETGYTKNHKVPIYGLYPNKNNKVVLEVIEEGKTSVVQKTLYIQTERLPESLQGIIQEKQYNSPSGVPLIQITGGEMYPFVFDNELQIRHYFKTSTSSYGVFPLKNGRYLWGEREIGVPTFANAHTCQLHEIDILGRIHRTLLVEKGVHHFAVELPNGNLICISNTLDGCTEDKLIEIDRSTGKVIREIDMRMLVGDEYRDMVDWVHPNALQYNEKEDSLLICMRNVHSVMKIRWSTLEVLWVLSIPEFWKGKKLEDKVLKPVGDIKWNYQAHAAHEVKDLQDAREGMRYYMVFDNHQVNRRKSEQFNPTGFSYINIFEVNEQDKTVSLFRQFEIPLSLIRSNAYYDSKSNHVFAMEGCLKRTFTEVRGRVLEIDYKTKEVINSCAIKKDFFSAHPFIPVYEPLMKPLEYKKDYMIGQLSQLKEMKSKVSTVGLKPEDKIILNIEIREEYLYIKAVDHSIEKVIFIGNSHCYEKDYTDTHQTNKFHKDRKYYVMIPIKDLVPDQYDLVIQSKGSNYSTDYQIKVNKGEDHE
ncbi:MAG: aryl-sulfate sulfotransferase [bacterium]|nr:aryl-sulfate sulfotransferase [bacterium]